MTMVRQYPPQPQQPFGLSPYNSVPPSPSALIFQNDHTNDHRHGGTQQLPQQYAHPLLRHNSYPSQASPKEQGHGTLKQSEHMLRRKTPNGVLAAAYDGTSSEKLHATKHILLPVTAAESGLPNSSPFQYNIQQELPLRSPGVALNSERPTTVDTSEWNPTLYFETGSGQPQNRWKAAQYASPQIDSMLNQMPLHQQGLPYQFYGQQFCGAMEPTLQSPLGPTISNDQGPYGPYWHDGTFIPYRPAALRDPRFYGHQAPHWNAHQSGYMDNGAADWQSYMNAYPNMNSLHQNPHLQGPPLSTFNTGKLTMEYASPYPQMQSQHQALDYQHSPLPIQFGHRPSALSQDFLSTSSTSGQTTPTVDHPHFSSVLAEFGPDSSNSQLRERVFAWAHSVYIDLLKYLQQTRKPGAHNRHHHGYQAPLRPTIYPKPPRQPGANFSGSSPGNNNIPTSERRSSHPSSSAPSAKSDSHDSSQPREILHRRQGSCHQNPGPLWADGNRASHALDAQRRSSLQHQYGNSMHANIQRHHTDPVRTLRRTSGLSITGSHSLRHEVSPSLTAASALDGLQKHCAASDWKWIDGMLLGACLAYALGDYSKSKEWNCAIIDLDNDHVEARSNLAATLLALGNKPEAEKYWKEAVKMRPSYFEAVEHLIGLLCSDHRGQEAVQIIEYVERSLKYVKKGEFLKHLDGQSERSDSITHSPSISELSDRPTFEFADGDGETVFKDVDELPGSDQPGFGSSGYAIPGSDNGRILALVHAKGNMLYALGDNAGAARAFENAVLVGAGHHLQGIGDLIKHILSVVGYDATERSPGGRRVPASSDPVLLPPEPALKTAQLCFPPHGQLPGLHFVSNEGPARKNAISTTSNSLLSLAKIFQDGMATSSPKASAYHSSYGVREILALYYLSLSLQPSPSTANNVGILLASVQQSAPSRYVAPSSAQPKPQIPGLVPGSGIALALQYYNYGLLLDSRHAHLFTNLGSLLKDIGQLDVAIQMYEQAVNCDGNFDIALANLANAVKDKGRIADAITYYRRAVNASPDFAEAVCGLANALNSVCGWQGRGGIATDNGARDRWHVDDKGLLLDATKPGASSSGWIKRVVDLVEKQLADGEHWGRGVIDGRFIEEAIRPLSLATDDPEDLKEKEDNMKKTLIKWQGQKWEGARLVRLVERAIRRLTWQWYQDKYISQKHRPQSSYKRPQVPPALTVPAAPTVLPFHTFTCPMSAQQIRLISQRNGLRISASTMRAPWLPPTVFPPPPPPNPYLKVGYVSSDFNNHPLAHLMQSVFGLHNPSHVKAFCYATTASDGSIHRQQIEREAPVFYDASSWSAERLVGQILQDGIHILINLNGYTRGARNEVFAARPAPIQMSFMGFAGTLGAEWCDYLLADDTAVPTTTLRPWRRNVDIEDQLIDDNSGGTDERWVYGENIIFCRDTFFCCDHRQSAPDSQGKQLNWEEEQMRRWQMRKEIFPQLPDDAIILGNFNQLYKIEPTTFRTWLRILARVPKAILWLLRFPDLGENNLRQTAQAWAGNEVASRIIFTDVAQKHQHISRARVCDLFLDTPECNAHTTAADVLWSGTPLLTYPRWEYKMCSRMAASILKGALPKTEDGKRARKELIATSEDSYEELAARLANGTRYRGYKAEGRLSELRKLLYESRWTSALFDTRRWVRDLEEAYDVAWGRWERGMGGDIWLK